MAVYGLTFSFFKSLLLGKEVHELVVFIRLILFYHLVLSLHLFLLLCLRLNARGEKLLDLPLHPELILRLLLLNQSQLGLLLLKLETKPVIFKEKIV